MSDELGSKYRISWPIRPTVIFSLEILEKNNGEFILIFVIYWKETGMLHTKISNHNIPYLSIDNAHLMYNVHPKLFQHSF